MFENNLHVGGLAQDANIRQHTVIHQIVRTHAVAAILAPAELSPLCFFDFSSDGGKDNVTLKLYTRALQGLHSIGIADQRALHVVDAEAVNHSILNHCVRLVADSCEEFFLAGVGSVHMTVEHQTAAIARAFPARDDVGASLFNFLPGNVEADGFPRAAHVLRHFGLVTRGAGNIDHFAAHRYDFFLFNLGEDSFDQCRVEPRAWTSV